MRSLAADAAKKHVPRYGTPGNVFTYSILRMQALGNPRCTDRLLLFRARP